MTERIAAWQCIGCGRVEAEQPCIGVCRDRRVEFVHASEHDEVLAQLARTQSGLAAVTAIIRDLACTTPREGQWERTYRALQSRARDVLAALGRNASTLGTSAGAAAGESD